jgi:murein DD-endopeptidase MepM/ murein hydrolase activator NlpD
MGLLDAPQAAHGTPQEQQLQATKQVTALLFKQMLTASGAFKGSGAAGSSLHADLFVDALADAIAGSDPTGLAAQLGRDVAPTPSPAPPAPPAAHAAPDVGPGGAVTSAFGSRKDPFTGQTSFHSGVDVGADEGSPIVAAGDGVVKKAGLYGGYGNEVEVDHGDGRSTVYAHASALLVQVGDRVQKGQVIARVGHTGRATGPHLHLELRQDGKAVDPASALKAYRGCVDRVGGDPPRR